MLLGQAFCQNVVWREVVPIDQAVRQKEEKNVREANLAEEGFTQAGVTVARKRWKFQQEEHFDDCGGGFGPSEEKPLLSAFVVEGSLGSVIFYFESGGHSFCSGNVETIGDELGRVFDDISVFLLSSRKWRTEPSQRPTEQRRSTYR